MLTLCVRKVMALSMALAFVVANSIMSAQALGHSHRKKPTPPPPPPTAISITPYVCDPDSKIVSDFVNSGGSLVYHFDGSADNTPSYPCENGGLQFNNVAGKTNFLSVGFELDKTSNCNTLIGPDVHINFSRGGAVQPTARAVCPFGFFTGIDSGNGFAIYNMPASAFGILSTDTINSISLVFFPGFAGASGPVLADKFMYNNQLIMKDMSPTAGCQPIVQTFYSCP